MLISKLEKNKAMKSEDKAEIMKTLEILTNSITKLKDELKGVSSGGGTPLKSMKTKTQVSCFDELSNKMNLHVSLYQYNKNIQLRQKCLEICYFNLEFFCAERLVLSSV